MGRGMTGQNWIRGLGDPPASISPNLFLCLFWCARVSLAGAIYGHIRPSISGPLAGSNIRPAILVNTSHPMNQKDSGRCFTLAHEICHILHDRGYAQRLSLISAPARVEHRVKALAALLFMPPIQVNSHIADLESLDVTSLEAVGSLSERTSTGFLATLYHLTNVEQLHEGQRKSWGGSLVEGGGLWVVKI